MPMSSHNEAEIYTPTDTIDQSIDEYDTEYPDGGSKAWLQVLSGNLCNALSWGLPASFGVFQLYYTETMHLPSSQVSWIGSIQVFLTFATCTIVGRLADSGYSRHCIFVGCAIIVSGTFITSICTAYWQILLAQGIYTGLGLGMVFMPTVAVIGCYFKRRRSLALSLSATGGGFGSLVFPSTVQYLIPQVGFPWAVRCAAFLALIMAIIANVCLCPRSMPTKPGPLVQLQAFREAPYFLFALSVFLYFLALYFGFFYINAYARNVVGFSSTEAVSLLLITNATGIPLRPIVGYIADRFLGPINTFIIAMSFLGCMEFVWISVRTRLGMYIFSAFFGMANGAAQGMFVGALASLTTDPREMGARFGMIATLSGFATLAGPPIAGAIIDATGGRYIWAQVWAGCMVLTGSGFLVAASLNSSKRI
ncbi:MFS monocarboxylate transporter [Lasiodiplodia theobromae]|uniref:MFS monocarboxylate transporter n=1 Tax=Lasiodiplodia theobromae TaxID=45133 RepID=UPI0015C3B798|nr:MFS monocarboxylate transporter [Lasiodiplodia theobromae]KAF4541595.1 MFS monocarboxylate transporter [Lasiodiplodia theobromae]